MFSYSYDILYKMFSYSLYYIKCPNECCNDEAIVRLWMMRKFFNTVHEEFAAWLTAAPTMSFDPSLAEKKTL